MSAVRCGGLGLGRQDVFCDRRRWSGRRRSREQVSDRTDRDVVVRVAKPHDEHLACRIDRSIDQRARFDVLFQHLPEAQVDEDELVFLALHEGESAPRREVDARDSG